MTSRTLFTAAAVALLCAHAACGPSRTAAATQTSPAAFEPGQSDERALAAVDRMHVALGGLERWQDIKQLRWEHRYLMDGAVQGWFRHAWDLWNGRHRFEMADMSTVTEADPDATKWTVVMYDLFSRDRGGWAGYGGQQLGADDRRRLVQTSYERWQADHYQLAVFYKLRDPGVRLEHSGQIGDIDGRCVPSCDTIRVTFAPEVGTDTYYLNINTATHLPEIFEKAKGTGRLGFAIVEWHEASGLKFPARMQNLGVPGEVFVIDAVRVGDPESALYVPQVR
jgi:hypothetical protein